MFTAAIRPAALVARRAALKPARAAVAARAFSISAARRSEHPTPQIFGEGAKPGEIPTDENQSTGLERLQVLGAIEGVEVFDTAPLDSSRIGTLADPIKVFSMEPERVIGCTGSPAESHELLWMTLTREKNRRCPECGSGMSSFLSPSAPPLEPYPLQSTPSTTRALATITTPAGTTECLPACSVTSCTTSMLADKSNPCFLSVEQYSLSNAGRTRSAPRLAPVAVRPVPRSTP
ncbi:cytochrome c oxidase subunit VB-domain-containing protein [Trametes polyzona]|nr:cytochrome c oxidase subunit VB-domain-containing protein [Trametes polyzona]